MILKLLFQPTTDVRKERLMRELYQEIETIYKEMDHDKIEISEEQLERIEFLVDQFEERYSSLLQTEASSNRDSESRNGQSETDERDRDDSSSS